MTLIYIFLTKKNNIKILRKRKDFLKSPNFPLYQKNQNSNLKRIKERNKNISDLKPQISELPLPKSYNVIHPQKNSISRTISEPDHRNLSSIVNSRENKFRKGFWVHKTIESTNQDPSPQFKQSIPLPPNLIFNPNFTEKSSSQNQSSSFCQLKPKRQVINQIIYPPQELKKQKFGVFQPNVQRIIRSNPEIIPKNIYTKPKKYFSPPNIQNQKDQQTLYQKKFNQHYEANSNHQNSNNFSKYQINPKNKQVKNPNVQLTPNRKPEQNYYTQNVQKSLNKLIGLSPPPVLNSSPVISFPQRRLSIQTPAPVYNQRVRLSAQPIMNDVPAESHVPQPTSFKTQYRGYKQLKELVGQIFDANRRISDDEKFRRQIIDLTRSYARFVFDRKF